MKLLVPAALALLAGCSVDRGVLEERIFECDDDEDCGTGYGCQVVDADRGFCAPRPAACDGARTADGLCIAECSVEAGGPCATGLQCVRGDVLGDSGYCADIAPCSGDSDCSDQEVCLSSFFADHPTIPFSSTGLWCARAGCLDDPNVCRDNEECVPFVTLQGLASPLVSLCLPACRGGRCAPGYSCIPLFGEDVGVCYPGLLGVPCRDDLGCLMGDCIERQDDKRCELGCEAGDGSLLCSPEPLLPDGALNQFVCTDHGCELRGGYFEPCGRSPYPDCGGALECMDNGLGYQGCQLACRGHEDCPSDAFCGYLELIDASQCYPRLPPGEPCEIGRMCRSGLCESRECA